MMTSLISQTNRLIANIDDIMNSRIENVKEVFIEEGRAMLSEFRARQYAASHLKMPGKNKADTAENKAKAIEYAKAHSEDNPLYVKGKTWFNRSFRAARSVLSYIEHNEAEGFIAVGLYHTMSYGAYLEYAHNRQYAVIEPIVRNHASILLNKIKQIMGSK